MKRKFVYKNSVYLLALLIIAGSGAYLYYRQRSGAYSLTSGCNMPTSISISYDYTTSEPKSTLEARAAKVREIFNKVCTQQLYLGITKEAFLTKVVFTKSNLNGAAAKYYNDDGAMWVDGDFLNKGIDTSHYLAHEMIHSYHKDWGRLEEGVTESLTEAIYPVSPKFIYEHEVFFVSLVKKLISNFHPVNGDRIIAQAAVGEEGSIYKAIELHLGDYWRYQNPPVPASGVPYTTLNNAIAGTLDGIYSGNAAKKADAIAYQNKLNDWQASLRPQGVQCFQAIDNAGKPIYPTPGGNVQLVARYGLPGYAWTIRYLDGTLNATAPIVARTSDSFRTFGNVYPRPGAKYGLPHASVTDRYNRTGHCTVQFAPGVSYQSSMGTNIDLTTTPK